MAKKIIPSVVYDMAKILSKKKSVSSFNLFESIYTLGGMTDKKIIHKKVIASNREYLKTDRINPFANWNGHEWIIKEKNEYRVIVDMYKFMTESYKSKGIHKSQNKLEETFKSSKKYRISLGKGAENTQYRKFVLEQIKEFYKFGKDREEIDKLNFVEKTKLILVDQSVLRAFAVKVSRSLESELYNRDFITSRGKILNTGCEAGIADAISERYEDLWNYLSKQRKKAGIFLGDDKSKETFKRNFKNISENDDVVGNYISIDGEAD